jgi:hypothetical protein
MSNFEQVLVREDKRKVEGELDHLLVRSVGRLIKSAQLLLRNLLTIHSIWKLRLTTLCGRGGGALGAMILLISKLAHAKSPPCYAKHCKFFHQPTTFVR